MPRAPVPLEQGPGPPPLAPRPAARRRRARSAPARPRSAPPSSTSATCRSTRSTSSSAPTTTSSGARIPAYARADLAAALSTEKSVFEYWAHALAYIPTRDIRFYLADMRDHRAAPSAWFGDVPPADIRRIVARIRRDGPLTIRDIDGERVEKLHLWASRKPEKRALEHAFYAGMLTVGARDGMVKTYELIDRHFGWPPRPRVATEAQTLDYLLDRALRAQGVVSLDSICYMDAPRKKADGGADRGPRPPPPARPRRDRRRASRTGRRPRRSPRPCPRPTASTSSRPSTRSSSSAGASPSSSTTTTASRPMSRPRNASSATSPCRSSSATASPRRSTSRPTAPAASS